MIHYTKGNLLESKAEALVNTVNTVGVMGKGIALQFKEQYPHNFKVYKRACEQKELTVGQLLIVEEETLNGRRSIINFPTKAHWKGKSKYEYIESGLQALTAEIKARGFQSVALPPLGCGNGGLEWPRVKALIEQYLHDSPADIWVYEPNEAIKAHLQREERPKEEKLTPARAMLLYLLFQYEAGGEPVSLFAANKLAYFLQRSGEPMRLKFEKSHYGPYTVQLNHVLYRLNGTYLHGLEQNEAKPFEPLHLNYDKWEEIRAYVNTQLDATQRNNLRNVMRLIQGFESSFALELLATVDFLLDKRPPETSVEDVVQEITEWSRRKTRLFREEFVQIARDHLRDHASELSLA
ncbi:O-acetyl-ADP-ribose deacetylase (regulator of RNase III), contains Macro domain [Catalinimonas alkaloidigena]|uniref:O-acetyl-ADP-ribose deacetylase (Regulator of RNase III), contains Macro domain n=1 Tax=Catalinimonas alkaloidigena TaxID=1075417 RepID=A0A1G9QL29_9BACT|nr:O-acetyl-ADP-ribose deacetylase (regulator of RNase III), contains Macro domain [Catalinimonas alkaloidigena]